MRREGFGRFALILALIVAVFLGVLVVRHHHQEQARMETLRIMKEKAEPLERELTQIQRELDHAEYEATQRQRMAFYVIGYLPSKPSDISYAMHQAQTKGFRPFFLLDPSAELYSEILETVQNADCDVVFTSVPFDESSLSKRPDLSDSSAVDSGAFLLQRGDDTKENLALLVENGFDAVVCYADGAKNAVMDNGLISVGYSRIRTPTFSVRERMYKADARALTLLFIFDLEALHNGEISDTDVLDDLDLILSGRKDETAHYGSVIEGLENVRSLEDSNQVSREELEAFAKEKQQRIDEIRAQLDEIYANWNGGDGR